MAWRALQAEGRRRAEPGQERAQVIFRDHEMRVPWVVGGECTVWPEFRGGKTVEIGLGLHHERQSTPLCEFNFMLVVILGEAL